MSVWQMIQSTSQGAVGAAVATPFGETEFIGESFPRKETGFSWWLDWRAQAWWEGATGCVEAKDGLAHNPVSEPGGAATVSHCAMTRQTGGKQAGGR